jgi:hypothetical protein
MASHLKSHFRLQAIVEHEHKAKTASTFGTLDLAKRSSREPVSGFDH